MELLKEGSRLMLKRLQNPYEKLTNDRVNQISQRYGATAYPKVRLADVFEIDGSGIPNALYRFALMAHFDTIVYDSDLLPLFAVEFDGKTHTQDQVQIERDQKKNDLCERFDLPLLRIKANSLNNKYRGMNLLSWFIEVWFAARFFEEAQKDKIIPYDEPFMPMNFTRIPGLKNDFPLWLSKGASGEIAKLYKKGSIQSFSPNTLIKVDDNKLYHCLTFVVMDDNNVVFSKNKMEGKQFPVPITELLEDITIVDLYEKLNHVLSGKGTPQRVNDLNNEIENLKPLRLISAGGQGSISIINSK